MNITERSLEVRINTLDDIKSVIQNVIPITQFMKEYNLKSIEFLIDISIKREAYEMLAGLFPYKVYYTLIKPRGNNVLYPLPRFVENLAS